MALKVDFNAQLGSGGEGKVFRVSVILFIDDAQKFVLDSFNY